MPTLFRRANGVYYYVLTEASGKRRWKSTGEQRKDRALAKIRQLVIQKEASGNSPSLDCFITEVLAYVRSTLSPGTLEIYSKTIDMFRGYMGNHRLPDFGHRRMKSTQKLTPKLDPRWDQVQKGKIQLRHWHNHWGRVTSPSPASGPGLKRPMQNPLIFSF